MLLQLPARQPVNTPHIHTHTLTQVTLFDVQQRSVIAELPAPGVKYVAWNADMSAVALLAKHAITVADKRLGGAQTVHETIRVKSAAWDEAGVLIYTTLNHVKYCLPNGDVGIIRTLESPLYLAKAEGGALLALDRDGRVRSLRVDGTECGFKLALLQRRYEQVSATGQHGQGLVLGGTRACARTHTSTFFAFYVAAIIKRHR
jgi:coatomer subunit alpha